MLAATQKFQLSYVRDEIVAATKGKEETPKIKDFLAREVMITGPPEHRVAVRNEDIFFAVACKRLGMSVPKRDVAVRFCIEETLPLSLDPSKRIASALHKPYGYQPPEVVKLLCESSEIEKAILEEEVEEVTSMKIEAIE